MNKAFLFDMDGVMADSETAWDKLGYDDMLKSYFGLDLFNKVKIKSGTSIKSIFDAFVSAGWVGDYDPFHKKNEKIAERIYHTIPLSSGLNELIQELAKQGFTIAVVSSSPSDWVETLISRLPSRKLISRIVSVNNHKTLKPKPSPDPYVYAMKQLGVKPSNTIVLEDSETGVAAGKASGAKVVCLTMHQHGYDRRVVPQNADFYAKTMEEVLDIVKKLCLI